MHYKANRDKSSVDFDAGSISYVDHVLKNSDTEAYDSKDQLSFDSE